MGLSFRYITEMATLVGILDRNWWGARTDVNILVEPRTHSLTWIPRDMYVTSIKNRINSVFYIGGDHEKYRKAADELGFPSDYSITIMPYATMQAFQDIRITVPVPYKMKFKYPLKPVTDIHLGEKTIEFNPPQEILSGERIHQWIGAREWVGPPRPPTQEFYRIQRQQVFLKKLLEGKFDFSLIPSEGVSVSNSKAYDDLRQVQYKWDFIIFDKAIFTTINGMSVLVKNLDFQYPWRYYPGKPPPRQPCQLSRIKPKIKHAIWKCVKR